MALACITVHLREMSVRRYTTAARVYTSDIQTFFVHVPPNVISPKPSTPKVLVYNSSYAQSKTV
jgi:hypothetical protein